MQIRKSAGFQVNYLAHVLLAGPDPADRLGGIMGDFVKGPLPAGLPPAVAAGVALHRSIDSYADRHPAFRHSRSLVSPERRRYAGVMVDLFYDHLLARYWDEFSMESIEAFSAGLYRLIGEHEALLPTRLAEILPSMRSQDWLAAYRSPEATGRALDGMAARRLSRPNRLAGALVELQARYAEFEADFRVFMPDARDFAAAVRAGRR